MCCHFLCGGFFGPRKQHNPGFFQKGPKYHFEAFPNDTPGIFFFGPFAGGGFSTSILGGVVRFFPAGASVYSSSIGAGVDHLSIHPRSVEWFAPDGFFPANRKHMLQMWLLNPVNYTIHTGVKHQLTID